MKQNPTISDLFNIPMAESNDANTETVGGYLIALASAIWEQEEGFSAKRPFGNSDWKNDIDLALLRDDWVEGELDEEGYIETIDMVAVDAYIKQLLEGLPGYMAELAKKA